MPQALALALALVLTGGGSATLARAAQASPTAASVASSAAASFASPSSGAATSAGTAAADVTVLDRFLAGLTSLRASFTQTVTDAHGARIDSGTGSLVLQRPGRFRWDYQPSASAASGTAGETSAQDHEPTGELLVADGRNLWSYDRELAEVTVKPLQAGLSATPILLLTGAPEDLRRYFDVMSAGMHDGLSWVQVKPRSEQADFSDARLGFNGTTLVRMVFQDMLDRSVQLDFSDLQRNARVDSSTFEFKVPAGVDVIGTPLTGPLAGPH